MALEEAHASEGPLSLSSISFMVNLPLGTTVLFSVWNHPLIQRHIPQNTWIAMSFLTKNFSQDVLWSGDYSVQLESTGVLIIP